MNKIHNIKIYKKKRQYLKNNTTQVEKLFWQKIKDSELGYKFRRQRSIKQYIVDFYCPTLKLIIELDGDVHKLRRQSQLDWLREKELKKLGFKIIRYNNYEIINDINRVIVNIKKNCKKLDMNCKKISSKKNGYITLISVLVVGAVGLAITLTLLLLGLGSSQTSLAFEQSNQAKALANSCAEVSLNNLKLDSGYSGDETINLGQGSCYISAVEAQGSQRTILTQGTVDTIIRYVEVVAQLQPDLQIISWQEIAGKAVNWWNTDWNKRKEITITNAGVTVLTDFPAYLRVLKETEMQADYDDLRFISGACADADSTELDYEIESYSGTEAQIWLRIPSLTIEPTIICMYYDNSSASSGENATGVWDSNYVSVYHLAHTTGSAIDTIGNFTAEEIIDPDTNMDVAGVVGRGDYFDGDDYLGNNPEWNVDGAHLYCVWLNFSTAHNGTILEDGGNGDGHGLGILTTGQLRYAEQYNGADNYLDSASSYDDGAWHQLCGSHTGTDQLLYIDSDLETSVTQGDGMVGGNNARIGSANSQNPVFNDSSAHYLNATLDEIRVSSDARSADWIKQSYEIVENQSSIVVFSSEEVQY